MAINEISADANVPAVTGEDSAADGGGIGVFGTSAKGFGVKGSAEGTGVFGESRNGWMGVYGHSTSEVGGAGVMGEAVGTGVYGKSSTSNGVGGESSSETGGAGVWAKAIGPGVVAVSQTWHGVYGETSSSTGGAGVWAEHKGGGDGVVGLSASGVGVHGKGGRLAAFFEGDVEVTGDIRLLNADCAEDFEVEPDGVEPGTVLVIASESRLQSSSRPYDRRVAGVVSGAGSYRPGLVLDSQGTSPGRRPVAMLGKVFCKADADLGPIDVGDLLTTSPTPGHAMAARDSGRMVGAVLGKALRPLPRGRGLIPILIALQ
jgi:hypothetical protein